VRGWTLLERAPGVDAGRIGAMGLSMGATHAYWLAALDDRVAAVAHLCAFAEHGRR
jgi:dipeptidyl aminopeptidase/acylaminoacyl peptidase